MSKKIAILYCTFILTTLIGCEPSYRTKSPPESSRKTYTIAKASYDIYLISVERSAWTKKISGEQRIETVIERGIPRFYFEDEKVRIKWSPAPYDIIFVLNNKSDVPVKIIWDTARFIDEKGVSHRLIHSGTGYEDRYDPHPPTVVAARGTLEDFIHPADYFQKEEDYGRKSNKEEGFWKRAPFLPAQIKGTAEELRAKAEPFVGKTFQVILPLQIDDVRNDYVSTFKINNVTVTQEKREQEKNTDKGKRSGKRMLF